MNNGWDSAAVRTCMFSTRPSLEHTSMSVVWVVRDGSVWELDGWATLAGLFPSFGLTGRAMLFSLDPMLYSTVGPRGLQTPFANVCHFFSFVAFSSQVMSRPLFQGDVSYRKRFSRILPCSSHVARDASSYRILL